MEIKDKFKALFNSKSEEELIIEDADILKANYLSEIERIFRFEGINKKDLANKIDVSPSYLTQVFRGDKPLNFITIAKIKRALNLDIKVKVNVISEVKVIPYKVTSMQQTDAVSYNDTTKEFQSLKLVHSDFKVATNLSNNEYNLIAS